MPPTDGEGLGAAIHRYEVEVEIDLDKASFRDVEEAVGGIGGVEFAAVMEVREPNDP